MSLPPPTISIEEQHQILNYWLNKTGRQTNWYTRHRNYLMICLMLETGVRVGELVQLTTELLYYNNVPVHTLILPEQITKNHKPRQIPISTRLNSALVSYLIRFQNRFPTTPPLHIFPGRPPTTHLTTRQVERILEKTALDSIGRPITPHTLRHTFASKLLKVTNIRVVQDLLGHSQLTSTQIYTHPDNDQKKDAINGMNTDST